MTSQVFLWLNVGFAVLMVGIIWLGRGRRPGPSRLNLKGSNPDREGPTMTGPENPEPESRTLNVLFVYNGHSFDAHEILGIPAGSRQDKVDEAYRRCLSSIGPQDRVFLEAAYNAITAKLKSR